MTIKSQYKCPVCKAYPPDLESKNSRIVSGQNTFSSEYGSGCEMLIECKCEQCGTMFQYSDGNP